MTKKQWPSIDHSILSPSGKISKRARQAAIQREAEILFADVDLNPPVKQPTEAERLRRQASQLLDLANRGMKPIAYKRLAAELIKQAETLEGDVK